jgi:ubiquinone/menaquinone biosynthesis C-methylase UbiE
MGGLLGSLPVRGAQRKYGVDFSRVGIEKCRRRIKGSFRIGDLHDLPYPDAAFERVMCIETLEHVDDPARVVAEMERVLKPRGKLLVTVPEQSRDAPDDHWPDGVSLHVRKFSAVGLRALIERSALHVESLTLDERTIWLVAEKAIESYRRARRRRKIKNKREPKNV